MRLFATHPVTVAVGLPHTEGSQLLSDVAIQPPAGLTPITNEDVMTGAGMDTFDGLTGATTFVGDAVLLRFSVLFQIRSAGGTNYGYDLDVRQGGRSVTRLRVAGNCHRIGGSIECDHKKVSRSP